MAVPLWSCCTFRMPVSLQNWNFPTHLLESAYLGVANCIFKSGTHYCQAITSVKIYLKNIMKEERQTDMGLDVQNKKAEFFTDINNADHISAYTKHWICRSGNTLCI